MEEDKYHLKINALKYKLEKSIKLLEEIVNETGKEIRVEVKQDKIFVELEDQIGSVNRQENIDYCHSRIKVANMVFYGRIK